jgi:HD-like signal output (HDOD) protein
MLNATFAAPGYQPPMLPSVAIELLHVTRQPDVTFPLVSALLHKEPLLASQVLRVAQSPAYRRAQPVRSLEQAARALGLTFLADVFLQASLAARVFRCAAYEHPMNQLRVHAVATAHISRWVSGETPHSDDLAFLCGLLHDVGAAACLIVLADAFGNRSTVPLSVVWPLVWEAHQAASYRLAELWHLPEDVQVVIGSHHPVAADRWTHPLAAVVCVADAIATDMGHGVPFEIDRGEVTRAQQQLGLSDVQLARIRSVAAKLLPTLV